MSSSTLWVITVDPEHLQLVPVGPRFLAVGWVGLSTYALGSLLALPSAHRKGLTLGLFGTLAVLGAGVSIAGNRYALKRVMAPPPPGAVVVSERFPTGSVLTTAAVAAVLVAASVVGTLSASILGAGLGGSVGSLWSAWKIAQFERNDGRRILRKVGNRFRSEPGLYAGP